MDYELLTNDNGVRLVKFGSFAGYAGIFWAYYWILFIFT